MQTQSFDYGSAKSPSPQHRQSSAVRRNGVRSRKNLPPSSRRKPLVSDLLRKRFRSYIFLTVRVKRVAASATV